MISCLQCCGGQAHRPEDHLEVGSHAGLCKPDGEGAGEGGGCRKGTAALTYGGYLGYLNGCKSFAPGVAISPA